MTSQFFIPVFLHVFLQHHITYALQSNTSFDFDLNNFSGVLKRGDNSKLVHKLKKHLMYLGYLGSNNMGKENNFDHHLEHAIKKYQVFYSLNVTGVVDIDVITSIRKPRCGFPDFFSPQAHLKSLYSFLPGNPRWRKKKLRYLIVQTTPFAYISAIEEAMLAWQHVTPFKFPRARNNLVDFTISFETGDHGDNAPFYPDSWEIAHSSKPGQEGGSIHFNGHKRWSPNADPDSLDIQTTAMHELGHLLGLDHSTVEEAIMFPQLGPGETKSIHEDDIQGIRVLYGFQD